ncbi:MAG: flagellar protein FlaG [Desulfamplus sp.]|nr:flagellar protein FlaG [Desulfamplus sp.]
MNINNIRSSENMDVLSPARTSQKAKEERGDLSRPDIAGQQIKNDQENGLRTNNLLKGEDEKKGKNEKKSSSMEDYQKMAAEMNEYMNELQTSIGFSVSKDPDNQVVFQIKNRSTDEIIKQIPAEEAQKIKQKMTELTGLILDHKA